MYHMAIINCIFPQFAHFWIRIIRIAAAVYLAGLSNCSKTVEAGDDRDDALETVIFFSHHKTFHSVVILSFWRISLPSSFSKGSCYLYYILLKSRIIKNWDNGLPWWLSAKEPTSANAGDREKIETVMTVMDNNTP